MKKLLLVSILLFSHVAAAQLLQLRGVRVTIAPPALRVETIPLAPSPRHNWIAGYWGWRGNQHVWMEGHWALPPGYNYVWQPARWENVNGAWMFYDGHWRAADQPDPAVVYQPPAPPVQETVVAAPPPAPLEEVQPPAPFEGAMWVPGYWNWSGVRYVWVGGRWSARPAGHVWDAGRWERRHDKWFHHPGHWHPH